MLLISRMHNESLTAIANHIVQRRESRVKGFQIGIFVCTSLTTSRRALALQLLFRLADTVTAVLASWLDFDCCCLLFAWLAG